ncbi:MAG: ribonuclease HIII, partial [Verrucomicrobiota bacterium]
FVLEPEILGKAEMGYEDVHHPERFEPHIGIDESGKGDFFGPLVIAAAYVDKEIVQQLMTKGVCDSKLIKSDQKARTMAEEIKRILGRKWSVIAIGPQKYNELYFKFKNLNRLLAWGHATVLENVLEIVPDCPRALSDKFADERLILNQLKERGQKIKMEQRTKAESDMAVAAASILARAAFLEGIEKLGKDLGTELLKGASGLVRKRGEEIAAKYGEAGLKSVSKAHFKTFQECLNPGLGLE